MLVNYQRTHRHIDELKSRVTKKLKIQEHSSNEDEHAEQQTEDPFRSLRSFHEKQRMGRQGGNQQCLSVSSHSTLEGAVGGAEPNYPKPQRMNKKTRQPNEGSPTQNQVPHQVRKEQESTPSR